MTPLMRASHMGNMEIVEVLIDSGANLKDEDDVRLIHFHIIWLYSNGMTD